MKNQAKISSPGTPIIQATMYFMAKLEAIQAPTPQR
jgi:hypothetical protein